MFAPWRSQSSSRKHGYLITGNSSIDTIAAWIIPTEQKSYPANNMMIDKLNFISSVTYIGEMPRTFESYIPACKCGPKAFKLMLCLDSNGLPRYQTWLTWVNIFRVQTPTDTLVNAAKDKRNLTEVKVVSTLWSGMVTVGNQGQDDR